MLAYCCAWKLQKWPRNMRCRLIKPHMMTIFLMPTTWRRNGLTIDMQPHPCKVWFSLKQSVVCSCVLYKAMSGWISSILSQLLSNQRLYDHSYGWKYRNVPWLNSVSRSLWLGLGSFRLLIVVTIDLTAVRQHVLTSDEGIDYKDW